MNLLAKVFQFIDIGRPSEKEINFALLIMRVVVAIIFIKFGYGKLFGAPGIEGFTGMLTMLSVPLPGLFAYLVGITEFVGGIAVLLGVATRVSALGLTVISFVAWATAKSFGLGMLTTLPNGDPFGGGVLDVFALGLTIALLIAGPGALSLSSYSARTRVHKMSIELNRCTILTKNNCCSLRKQQLFCKL